MPKCVTPGCDQTAFYGTVFNMPRWCKAHMAAGSGSVRKRCVVFDCSNAVFGNAPECGRCSKVTGAIESYRRKMLDDLKVAIDRENATIVLPPVAVRTAAAAKEPVQKEGAKEPRKYTGAPRLRIAPEPAHVSEPGPRPLAVPEKFSGSRFVRTSDDEVKPGDMRAADVAFAKKRAQTPGRPRSTTLSQDM